MQPKALLVKEGVSHRLTGGLLYNPSVKTFGFASSLYKGA